MNVEEAWNAFVKSQAVKKASIDEKLDVLASQMNEVQTTVDRLAETIPEAQGDAGAMELANDAAMTEPNPEEALGEVAGAPEEEGVAAPGGSDAPMPEECMEDELGEEDLAGDMPPMDEGMPEGGDVPPLTEEEMDAPAIGESNDVISMVKEMIASEDNPEKLGQLSRLLDAAVSTSQPQNNQSYEAPESEMQMMKSDSVAKTGEGTGVVGEKSTVDTDGNNTSGESPVGKEGAAAAEAGVDNKLEDAPVAESASVDGPTPELMEKIMDAVKGVLVEYYGEGSEEDIGESAEEAATDGEEAKVDDEDAEVHVDVEDGGNVTVEDEDDDDGDEEISDADKIGRNDELSDDSAPFTDSDCINKSFADMLHGKIAQTVGVDGQFAKGTVAKGFDDYNDYQNSIESKYLDESETDTLNALRGKGKGVANAESKACAEGDYPVIGSLDMAESESATVAEPEGGIVAESENAEPVAESDCAKTEEADVKKSTDNGKQIMSLRDMMAIQKSADRMDVASTSYGSLNPPTLEGAAPIRMVSFKDMMGSGDSIRKSIEADADAYRLYKSQQNM